VRLSKDYMMPEPMSSNGQCSFPHELMTKKVTEILSGIV
jgi:hypothetical protein